MRQPPILESFIPNDRRQALANGEALPERARGAVLFADISGFSALTMKLEEESGAERAAEALSFHLDRIYGVLIGEVHGYGGSVIGFSGDAVNCWFDAGRSPQATAQALECAQSVRAKLAALDRPVTPSGRVIEIGIKIAVTAGDARRFVVGNQSIQSVDVLAGRTLDRAAVAEQLARTNEIIAGEEVVTELGSAVSVNAWRKTSSGERFASVSEVRTNLSVEAPSSAVDVSRDAAEPWVLEPVRERILGGEERFVAAIKWASALFVKFSGIDYDGDDRAGEKLDHYIQWVQSVVEQYQGHLLQVTLGDKGSYLYISFGALLTHEDDPARALETAHALRHVPARLETIERTQIGVGHGKIYAGMYGSSVRRTFGALGDEVNNAALLMSRADAGEILVTNQAARAAEASFLFEPTAPILLKGRGRAEPQQRLVGKKERPVAQTLTAGSETPLVGREKELVTLRRAILSYIEEGRPCRLSLEGEAGIGKSRLVAELIRVAGSQGATIWLGAGDGIENATPYRAWRPIFRQLFGIAPGDTTENVREKVTERLASEPMLHERAPLFNPVLPARLEDNHLTSEMTDELRAINTSSTLLQLLRAEQEGSSSNILIMEDAQWLDSASRALLNEVLAELSTAVIIVTRDTASERPNDEEGPDGAVADPTAVERIVLAPLEPTDIVTLVTNRLGVEHLPESVSDLILERAEGNPVLAEEIALALRGMGLITIDKGRARVQASSDKLAEVDLPTNVQGIVTSRLDRLPASVQLTLKVASVIGRRFSLETLVDVHPVASEASGLGEHIASLEESGILEREGGVDGSCSFRHAVTHEAAYDMLLPNQKQEVHHAVATWLEARYADNLEPHDSRLAFHWNNAVASGRVDDASVSSARFYLERVASQALSNGAYKEAIQSYDRLLEIDGTAEDRPRGLERAHQRASWTGKLAEAHVLWGDLTKGRRFAEKGAALLGFPLPNSTWGLVASIPAQAARQVVHRLWPSRFVARHRDDPRYREAADLCQALSQLYYLSNDQLRSFSMTLRLLNVSEAIGPCHQLAVSYSRLATLCGVFGWRRTAENYAARAVSTAEELAQPITTGEVLTTNSVFFVETGRWERAATELEDATTLLERYGERTVWATAKLVQGGLEGYKGEFARSAAIFASLANRRDGTLFHRSVGYAWQGLARARLGDAQQAIDLCEQGLGLHAAVQDPVRLIPLWAFMAQAQRYREEWEGARESADNALRIMDETKVAANLQGDAFAAIAEVYLALWERRKDAASGPDELLMRSAQRVVKAIRFFPMNAGVPAAKLYDGWYAWLTGKRRHAFKRFREGLNAAERSGMPFMAGVLHWHLGRHLDPDDPERDRHLRSAREAFSDLATPYELRRVDFALEDDVKNASTD